MTRTRISLLTAVVALSGMAISGAAHADGFNRGLVLINHSNALVSAFYVSATGGKFGASDLLDGGKLRPNHYVELDLQDSSGFCRFDFKTVYADGTSVIIRNVDACTFKKYDLTK